MLTQISITINNKHFALSLERDFANFLQGSLMKDLNIDGNNDIKHILQAYIRAKHDLYIYETKCSELIEKLDA